MATEKQVKQAIKQVLDSEYMNKMVTFDKGWKFKVKSYNIRTRSRFIPKNERDDYGCDVDANKFFIIEFNNAKDEMDATDAAAIYDHFTPHELGVSASRLWNYGITEQKPYRNNKVIIRRGVIQRKKTNRKNPNTK